MASLGRVSRVPAGLRRVVKESGRLGWMSDLTRWSVVVMAKAAVPGRVKTRLTKAGAGGEGMGGGGGGAGADEGGEGGLSPETAAAVHTAMMETVLKRTQRYMTVAGADPSPSPVRWVLAMDDPSRPPAGAIEAGWVVIDQGTGDLGQRLKAVWRREREAVWGAAGAESAASEGADAGFASEPSSIETEPGAAVEHGIVFFGVDCPDVPAAVLAGIIPGIEAAALTANPPAQGGKRGRGGLVNDGGGVRGVRGVGGVGPVSDGGYWTLGWRGFCPALVEGIDWGGGGGIRPDDPGCRRGGSGPADLGGLA